MRMGRWSIGFPIAFLLFSIGGCIINPVPTPDKAAQVPTASDVAGLDSANDAAAVKDVASTTVGATAPDAPADSDSTASTSYTTDVELDHDGVVQRGRVRAEAVASQLTARPNDL